MQVLAERNHMVIIPSHRAVPIESKTALVHLFSDAGKASVGDKSMGKPDFIINCAGAIPGRSVDQMVLTNGLGPHNLAALGIPMIHMSTDCVFSGLKQEDPWPDPRDVYGRSKLLGEPDADHVLVVRGSFIDPRGGFLKWLLAARGKVDAWEGVYWNGTSASHMAKALVGLMDRGEGQTSGLINVSSDQPVTKGWMVRHFVNALGLEVDVTKVYEPKLRRVLKPAFLTVPTMDMCLELAEKIKEERE